MKNLSAFLLCGFVLLGLSCDNSKEGPSQEWFRPTEVAVDGTTATATCLTLFNRGVLLSGSCGFVCMPVSSASGLPTITVPDPEIDGSILRCRLSSLAAETNYAIYPYVEFGTEHLEGVPTVFRTGKEPEKPDEPDPDEPDPDEPDPDEPTPPQPGGYPGWPELPKMEERPGDYYYATHICPTFTTASGVSETNLRSYTVCYSHGMMSGMWSAYPIHASYKGSSGRNDSFAYDPKIAPNLQPVIIQSAGSYKPQPGYSRGHLLASNDRTASEGMNNQTFYVTNMAPQWQNGFNSGVWSSLEDKTWNYVCADTLFVVSGVYYANTDKTVTDNAKPTPNTVYVPTNFYKVMIRSKSGNTGKPLYELSADEMQCIGFWFENKSYSGNSLTAYRTTVADIEQKTGMTFFPNVPDAPKESSAGNWSF